MEKLNNYRVQVVTQMTLRISAETAEDAIKIAKDVSLVDTGTVRIIKVEEEVEDHDAV